MDKECPLDMDKECPLVMLLDKECPLVVKCPLVMLLEELFLLVILLDKSLDKVIGRMPAISMVFNKDNHTLRKFLLKTLILIMKKEPKLLKYLLKRRSNLTTLSNRRLLWFLIREAPTRKYPSIDRSLNTFLKLELNTRRKRELTMLTNRELKRFKTRLLICKLELSPTMLMNNTWTLKLSRNRSKFLMK